MSVLQIEQQPICPNSKSLNGSIPISEQNTCMSYVPQIYYESSFKILLSDPISKSIPLKLYIDDVINYVTNPWARQCLLRGTA